MPLEKAANLGVVLWSASFAIGRDKGAWQGRTKAPLEKAAREGRAKTPPERERAQAPRSEGRRTMPTSIARRRSSSVRSYDRIDIDRSTSRFEVSPRSGLEQLPNSLPDGPAAASTARVRAARARPLARRLLNACRVHVCAQKACLSSEPSSVCPPSVRATARAWVRLWTACRRACEGRLWKNMCPRISFRSSSRAHSYCLRTGRWWRQTSSPSSLAAGRVNRV